VVRGKTAALFSAATESGAVVAGADDVVARALFDYGDALGIAFQIADDLLDYRGTNDRLGKNVGDDFRERKMSLPVIRALARADAAERDFWQRVIGKGEQRDGDLATAMAIMTCHGSLDSTRDTALEHAARARAALGPLREGPIRSQLADLADFVVARLV
jgi:octaprenyl-diphosphate synthase